MDTGESRDANDEVEELEDGVRYSEFEGDDGGGEDEGEGIGESI